MESKYFIRAYTPTRGKNKPTLYTVMVQNPLPGENKYGLYFNALALFESYSREEAEAFLKAKIEFLKRFEQDQAQADAKKDQAVQP